jgi:autotransporter-associated beta strand protein
MVSIDRTTGLNIAAGAEVDYRLATSELPPYAISGSGALALTSGTLTLSGTNTYTGGTDVLGGRLVVTSPRAVENGTGLFVGSSNALFSQLVPASRESAPPTAGATGEPTPIPEPGTLALFGVGVMTTVSVLRWRKQTTTSATCEAAIYPGPSAVTIWGSKGGHCHD